LQGKKTLETGMVIGSAMVSPDYLVRNIGYVLQELFIMIAEIKDHSTRTANLFDDKLMTISTSLNKIDEKLRDINDIHSNETKCTNEALDSNLASQSGAKTSLAA
jgi:hypothetical protein